MYLGELIRQYREKERLTMADFAIKSGLSKGYISMLEKNRHPQNNKEIVPSIETLDKVAKALNLSLNEILLILNKDQQIDISHESSQNLRYTASAKLDTRTTVLLEKYTALSEPGKDYVDLQVDIAGKQFPEHTAPTEQDLLDALAPDRLAK